MQLEELKVYQISMDLSNQVHDLIIRWDNFYKFSIGQQLMRSADSISSNISEGFGRYHYKDHKNFLYFSRGSLFETKTWLNKAFKRNLISEEEYNLLMKEYNSLGIKLNNYIKSIGSSPNNDDQ